jgi:hypothetical protein|tara:strand:+ start:357 stop:482 length:126 start_codon:yes stop_codon:yes gene_type:complete
MGVGLDPLGDIPGRPVAIDKIVDAAVGDKGVFVQPGVLQND